MICTPVSVPVTVLSLALSKCMICNASWKTFDCLSSDKLKQIVSSLPCNTGSRASAFVFKNCICSQINLIICASATGHSIMVAILRCMWFHMEYIFPELFAELFPECVPVLDHSSLPSSTCKLLLMKLFRECADQKKKHSMGEWFVPPTLYYTKKKDCIYSS